ncbi:MAG: MG2 domain-containing protein [Blastocatellia bacterium]|nr:MG2 domain-containing protein [Blastocatellia bacterium]
MRHRLLGLGLLCLLAAAMQTGGARAVEGGMRVDESATRVRLEKGETRVALAVENLTGRVAQAMVRLEWLDPKGRVEAMAERRESIRPGASAVTIPLPLKTSSDQEALWRRLRYRVAPDAGAGATITGIIALSEITPDLFELHVLASAYPYPGKRYRAHVRAVHPITLRPVRGVAITARLAFDNDQRDEFKAAGLTDARGHVALDFDLPRDVEILDGKVEFAGVRGEFRHEVEEDLNSDHLGPTDLMLTTDKPIYQPGQTLHVRSLAFDFMRRAIAKAKLNFSVTDPEGTLQFRADATTTRFGIASIDWQIPENARLGEYTIRADFEDDDRGGERELRVRISRYDLPNFAVKAKPDRAFYLAGQNAEVEIRADYLFGRPVKRGRVRVVREREREWNYRQQKWEIDEAEKYEGETDDAGRFVARIDLFDAHQDLKEESYRRFADRTYAAYFTDETTGRTEQRRFDLRVTRDAIHVYVIGGNQQTKSLPVRFFVSTSYADGTPASCAVAIGQKVGLDSVRASRDEFIEEPLRTVRTNRYGVAKVAGLRLRDWEKEVALVLAARDGKGATGRLENTLWEHGQGLMRIETDKSIYGPGEPIEIQLVSTEANADVILSLSRDLETLHSQPVRIRNGRAFVVIPGRREFVDVLTITADMAPGAREIRPARRQVIFPRDRELRLTAQLDRAEYRPGEEVRASFRMLSPEGRPIESAVGVTVIDSAVEERARTDREFSGGGGYFDYLGSYFARYGALAGVSTPVLRKLDMTKPLPAGLDLVAEALFHDDGYEPRLVIGGQGNQYARAVFGKAIAAELDPLKTALDETYQKTGEYPIDDASLDRVLRAAGKRLDELADPWGAPYHATFSIEREMDVLKIFSGGPDEKRGTTDDFVAMTVSRPYFKPIGDRIARFQREFLDREAAPTLDPLLFRQQMARSGLDFDALRDRWGRPCELDLAVTGIRWTVIIRSAGENGKFEARDLYSSDDFVVWSTAVDYFETSRARVDAILAAHFRATAEFPENESQLRAVLERGGLPASAYRDAWGNAWRALFSNRFRYADRAVISYDNLQSAGQPKSQMKPVTQRINFILLRSSGADGRPESPDDFTLAEFSRVYSERTGQDSAAKPLAGGTIQTGDAGALSGVVIDPTGAAIAGASVRATNLATGQTHQVRTEEAGDFLIRNLSAGRYEVRCESPGFKAMIVVDVPVQSQTMTTLNLTLDVGTVSEAVAVTGAGAEMQTEANSMMAAQVADLPGNGRGAAGLAKLAPGAQLAMRSDSSTPRLREHFQETLVWRPMIETDRHGRAVATFKLADNITTWKMKVVGSTADGEIAVAEKEFAAFQPFFAEHDPPRVLTEGDEISLPVVLRNYLPRPQTVEAVMKPESWFTLLGPARKRAEIAAGDAARVLFDFRAAASIRDGRQRVTAIGVEAGDAIERPVNVHPDGEEVTQAASAVFADAGAMELFIAENAIPGSSRAELKIYPNLLAHALESIEGILQRPHGCAEQTISTSYPNVMALRSLRGQDERAPEIAAKARRYAQRGYERLLGYRGEDGGFSYWGFGESDLALTAYAVRFLTDARPFVAVDEEVVEKARQWLIKNQQPDGRWIARFWGREEDSRRTALQTAFVARVLAIDAAAGAKLDPARAAALKRALDYLARRAEEIDEPYLIASLALALLDAGDRPAAEKPLARLRSLAREEAGGAYWNLETNTPFYGWGLAGRIESTALVVKALRQAGTKDDELANRGLLFLMRNKDRYGVWLSTQATINVLDALVSLNDARGDMADAGGQAEIFVNGRRLAAIALPPADRLSSPIAMDLGALLTPGRNRVEIRRSGNAARATAQLVETHYEPWTNASAARREALRPGAASALRLSVQFDKSTAAIGETVTCRVTAERIGHRGYGMLLGEIGLPPGAEVDRASLERAVKEAGWDLNHYDVLPDRLVVYLWPRAGGTDFSFTFRPRYGIRAQTAPSTLYDYYNPEARVALAPVRFVVR